MLSQKSNLAEKVNEAFAKSEASAAKKSKSRYQKNVIKETVTDSGTGEVLAETVTRQAIRKRPPEPQYVKFYIDDLILINELPTKSSSILWELVKLTAWGNKIILNGAIKKDICARLDIKMSTLNNALSNFVKKEILYRLDTGIYMPNPYLFARGDWEYIDDLRLIVDYKPDGKKSVELEINGKKAIDINNETDGEVAVTEE